MSSLTTARFQRYREPILYLVIGGTAAILDAGSFACLTYLVGTTALVSHALSAPIGGAFSFFCNASWNFRRTDDLGARAGLYALVALIGYSIGFVLISVGGALGVPDIASKVASLPFIAALQYVLHHQLTFGDRSVTETRRGLFQVRR